MAESNVTFTPDGKITFVNADGETVSLDIDDLQLSSDGSTTTTGFTLTSAPKVRAGWETEDDSCASFPDGFPNIEEIASLHADLSYEFDIFMVVRNTVTGDVHWVTDSGCSCPSPFEDICGPEAMEGRVDHLRPKAFLTALGNWMSNSPGESHFVSPSEYVEFTTKVLEAAMVEPEDMADDNLPDGVKFYDFAEHANDPWALANANPHIPAYPVALWATISCC